MARIAIFDYRIVATNPIGGCHLRLLKELSREHEFTVFAVAFDNPDPARIKFIRIPAPKRPLAALFAGFHMVALLAYAAYRMRGGRPFDAVQMVESNLSFGDLSYAHFCHRGYLRDHWKHTRPAGIRRPFQWLDHRLHAIMEPSTFRRVKMIVVPSRGLARELSDVYPYTAEKIRILPNAIDAQRLARPAEFDRQQFRATFGVAPDDVVMVFVALGHFERKGLPHVLEAMRTLAKSNLKLVVVGGSPELLNDYRRRASQKGVEHAIRFVGPQSDIRPYLWSADAFIFPSVYETFCLAIYEAAAAGLPLLSCRLNVTEAVLQEGRTGFGLEPNAASVAAAIEQFLGCSESQRRLMAVEASRAAQPFDVRGWADRWREVYAGLNTGAPVLAGTERGAHVA